MLTPAEQHAAARCAPITSRDRVPARYTSPRELAPGITFYGSCTIDGRATWGYRLTCAHCGADERCPVGSSVSHEDAPGAFRHDHADCADTPALSTARRTRDGRALTWAQRRTESRRVLRYLPAWGDTGYRHGPQLPALDTPDSSVLPSSYAGPMLQADGESRAYWH